jgi:hypothetical protein
MHVSVSSTVSPLELFTYFRITWCGSYSTVALPSTAHLLTFCSQYYQHGRCANSELGMKLALHYFIIVILCMIGDIQLLRRFL